MASPQAVKLLDNCQISPPPVSVPSTILPLTFLDIPWFLCAPTKRLFFYEFAANSDHFLNHLLPILKHSLSLTLHHFFPLAGHLHFPPPPAKPHLIYRDGNSVALSVVESVGDFNIISGNHPRDCKAFLPLVAQLPQPQESGESITYPMMALQVTIFPNSGICISITNLHMIDGRTLSNFIKSWASVCKSGGEISCLKNSLPFHDRSIIKDPNGILDIYLQQWYELKQRVPDGEIGSTNIHNVRATLSMSGEDIKRMKLWISTQLNNNGHTLHLSTFSAAIAFIWVCMVKTKHNASDYEIQNLAFLADCRNSVECEVPTTYFGNCLVMPVIKIKKCDLLGENGVVMAAQAIASKIDEVKVEPLKGIENWTTVLTTLNYSTAMFVAGSPRLKHYETDFGWGKPKKSEVVHIVDSSVVCIGDHRDDEDGIEIGLTLTKPEMHTFSSLFQQGMKVFS